VPAILNGRQHGVVIQCVIGTPGKAERVGNDKSRDVPAPEICVATATGIPKTSWASAGEIAFIPGNEDDRIAGPCFGRHDGVDRAEKERIAGRDQRLDLRKIAGISGSGASSVHVVTLVWTDPDTVRDGIVGKIGGQLAEVDNVDDARRVGLNALVTDERIMLALVKLVAASVIERSRAEGIGLHVSFPGFSVRFQLVDYVGDINRGVIVVGHAIRGPRSGGDVVGLARVCDAVITCRETSGGGGEVNEWGVWIANLCVVAGILHHDDEDMIESVMVAVPIMGGKTERHGWNSECGNDCA